MKSKYTVLVIEDIKFSDREAVKLYKKKGTVYIAALPEEYLDTLTNTIDEIQDAAAKRGIL